MSSLFRALRAVHGALLSGILPLYLSCSGPNRAPSRKIPAPASRGPGPNLNVETTFLHPLVPDLLVPGAKKGLFWDTHEEDQQCNNFILSLRCLFLQIG